MRWLSEIRGLTTGLALVALLLLAAVSVDFGIPGQGLLGSLRFHLGLVALVLPLVFFATKAWWRGVVTLLLIAASLGQGAWVIADLQQSRAIFDGRVPAAQLDVMSFNILGHNPGGAAIRDMLIAEAPDMAIILESGPLEPYLDELSATFPFRAGCADGTRCDLIILSRLPLTGVNARIFGQFRTERFVVAHARVDGMPFTIVGMHLTKPYFDDAARGELMIAVRMMERLGGPLILSGDFNAAPWSDNIARFAEAAGLVQAPRHPGTWPVELGALGVPIDNMFTRGNALVEELAAMPDALGSNHLGLRASVGIYTDN